VNITNIRIDRTIYCLWTNDVHHSVTYFIDTLYVISIKFLSLTPNRLTCDTRTEDRFDVWMKCWLNDIEQMSINLLPRWFLTCRHLLNQFCEMVFIFLTFNPQCYVTIPTVVIWPVQLFNRKGRCDVVSKYTFVCIKSGKW